MKIIDRKTFLSLPAGVLYSKYAPCVFGDLQIKGDTVGQNDFYTQQIADSIKCHDSGEFVDILSMAEESGESFDLDLDIEGRDGLFEDKQKFAVWETADMRALIERLTRLVSNASVNRRAD
jgi:hypothetical protein